MDQEDDVGEARPPKKLRDPGAPTQEEIDDHEASGHVVHRSWCGHCLRARGLVERHHLQGGEDRAIPTISLDYYYYGKRDRDQERELPGLQVKDEHSGTVWSSVVPAQGVDQYAINFVMACLNECGYTRVIMKSDDEPAIKALKEAVKGATKVEVILEEAKTGDHQANGAVEQAVNETKKQVRAMKSWLEEKLGVVIDDRHAILTWLARHANFLITRYRIGQDGKTGYERLKGKRWKRPMVAFGERIWFRPLKSYTAGDDDLAPRLITGVYVGTHGRNGDVLVMTDKGVIKGGSVKKTAADQRWSKENFTDLKGTPWKMRPQVEGDMDAPIPIDLPPAEGRLMPEPVARDGNSGPRNLYVRRRDVEGNPTPGCEGCHAILVGLPARAHSNECRTLVQQRLLQTDDGRARVEQARKRKQGSPGEGDQDLVLGPELDPAEEIHAPAAIGAPEERVGPVVRPVPRKSETQRDGDESAKKRRSEDKKGVKRSGDDLDDLFSDLLDDPVAPGGGEASSSGAAAPSSAPVVESPQVPQDAQVSQSETPDESMNCLEIASLLKTDVFQNAADQEAMEIGQLLKELGMCKADVAEIYNPERFTSRANNFGLRPGFAIDLEVCKNQLGDHWDLSREEDKAELKWLLKREDPFALIGSPPCHFFSPLLNLSKDKRTSEQNEKIHQEGREHLLTALDAYKDQKKRGRIFLHEHPKNASSWKEPEMEEFCNEPGNFVVSGPMCKWHMVSEDNQGVGYVRKETKWLTNSEELANVLDGECDGSHRHVHLVNGRARSAQVYPPKLVAAILRGIKKELRSLGEINHFSEVVGSGPIPDGTGNEQTEPFFDADDQPEGIYFDSVTGIALDTQKVLAAREEEMKWVNKQQLYEVVDESVCWAETGRPPIGLKWVDRNKGDSIHENFRSRLVVREIKKVQGALAEFESFSAMPPLEALKALCSLMVTQKVSKRGNPLQLKILDISRAHFYGVSRRRVFTNLPEGSEQPGKCALLVKSMYGTLDAASIWQQTYSEILQKHNIRQGKAWPALFFHEGEDLRFLVHGDDFVCLGDEQAHQFLMKVLDEKFEYRVDGSIGPGALEKNSMTVLNRIISYDHATGEVTYEADPRHAEHIVKSLKLEGSKRVSSPAEKPKLEEVLAAENLPLLSKDQCSEYRSLTMRAAYLSSDRPDISEAVKTLARFMSKPTEYSWSKLKRLGRYLGGHMRVVQHFKPQRMYKSIRAYCDSDFGGCLTTRKSTTGLCLMVGQHCLKHSSNLQSTVSLSSGEAEYYALIKASSAGMGMRAMFEEWGISLDIKVLSDSSAARGTVSRRGLGKTRHIQTRYLWVQEKVVNKDILIEPVSTVQNISDLCTKPLSEEPCVRHMKTMGFEFTAGRSGTAKLLS